MYLFCTGFFVSLGLLKVNYGKYQDSNAEKYDEKERYYPVGP